VTFQELVQEGRGVHFKTHIGHWNIKHTHKIWKSKRSYIDSETQI